MGERKSEYELAEHGWYVEPEWCIKALVERVPFVGQIHDPCCGLGTIPRITGGSGADLIDRGFGFPARDFLTDETIYDNIVTNPPYGKLAQPIIEHALKHTRRYVCALVQTKFLHSQGRHNLFSRDEMERLIMFSRRPSMPPGEVLVKHGESIRGNGSIDFCWAIWNAQGNPGPVTVEWYK